MLFLSKKAASNSVKSRFNQFYGLSTVYLAKFWIKILPQKFCYFGKQIALPFVEILTKELVLFLSKKAASKTVESRFNQFYGLFTVYYAKFWINVLPQKLGYFGKPIALPFC